MDCCKRTMDQHTLAFLTVQVNLVVLTLVGSTGPFLPVPANGKKNALDSPPTGRRMIHFGIKLSRNLTKLSHHKTI